MPQAQCARLLVLAEDATCAQPQWVFAARSACAHCCFTLDWILWITLLGIVCTPSLGRNRSRFE